MNHSNKRLGVARHRISILEQLAFRTRPRQRVSLLHYWPLWERLARRIWYTVPIPNAPYGVFAVHIGQYQGEPIDLPDGTHVQQGDLVGELHVNSQALVELVCQYYWGTLPRLEEDLQALADWAIQPDFPQNVKAFYGITLLSSGAGRLGFTRRNSRINLRTRLNRFFLMGLLALYNPKGFDRLLQGTTYSSYPQEVWMSHHELLRRYGKTTQISLTLDSLISSLAIKAD